MEENFRRTDSQLLFNLHHNSGFSTARKLRFGRIADTIENKGFRGCVIQDVYFLRKVASSLPQEAILQERFEAIASRIEQATPPAENKLKRVCMS